MACIKPPECDDSMQLIKTNADLMHELVRTRHNLKICKMGRDALLACLEKQG